MHDPDTNPLNLESTNLFLNCVHGTRVIYQHENEAIASKVHG